MTDDDTPTAATSSAGWCAPAPALYSAPTWEDIDGSTVTLPLVSVARGGITYDTSPEARAAAEAARAHVTRATTAAARLRHAAIDAACAVAAAHGWDIHVYDPPPAPHYHPDDLDLHRLTYVGIAYTPAEHRVPTIQHHPAPDWWDEDDED